MFRNSVKLIVQEIEDKVKRQLIHDEKLKIAKRLLDKNKYKINKTINKSK